MKNAALEKAKFIIQNNLENGTQPEAKEVAQLVDCVFEFFDDLLEALKKAAEK